MAARKFTDPKDMPFLTENYDKEKWLRMHWVNRHTEGLKRATTLNREPTNYTLGEIRKSVIISGMVTATKHHLLNAGNRRKTRVKDNDLVKLDKERKIEPAMKPVPEELVKMLYTDCKDDYLKMRKLVPPDKKYNFMECSSWEYGWQFDKSEMKLRGSDYGKIYHITRFGGVNPQTDPPHYYDCNEIFKKCLDM